jgi:radical SAM protein with 4Fe4S-binding SPASM domain
MSQHRTCADPHKRVAIDGDCNVSACTRWLLLDGKMGKVWEPDFWKNDRFEWLRGVHSPHSQQSVPRSCQNCPHNC